MIVIGDKRHFAGRFYCLSAGDAARYLQELERGETSGPAVAALGGMLQAALRRARRLIKQKSQKLSHTIYCSSIEKRTLHR